jgi:hypothetical protein
MSQYVPRPKFPFTIEMYSCRVTVKMNLQCGNERHSVYNPRIQLRGYIQKPPHTITFLLLEMHDFHAHMKLIQILKFINRTIN